MRRRALLLMILGIAVLLMPAGALAKGASEATITGPGLGKGISLAGEGQADGDRLMRLADEAGFFPAVFLTTPNPMLANHPDVELGPRYTIVYTMPGPNNDVNEIRQDLYPYATPTPVTYVESGQRYFTTERTVGGWYVASQTLRSDLVAVGLPENPPQSGDGGDGVRWGVVGAAIGTASLCAAILCAYFVRLRRRSHPAPA
jgi:hypothetical protein